MGCGRYKGVSQTSPNKNSGKWLYRIGVEKSHVAGILIQGLGRLVLTNTSINMILNTKS